MPKKFLPYPSSKKAFTLVEILVVIGIIVILSSLVVTALNPAQLRRAARDTNRQKDLSLVSSALEQYYADNNFYPAVTGSGTSAYECLEGILENTDIDCGTSGSQTGATTYLKTVPLSQSAPTVDTEYCYLRSDTQNYVICAPLEADVSTVMNGGGTTTCTVSSPTGGSLGSQYGLYCITNPF